MADEETLLGASSVHLFGRTLSDLILRGGAAQEKIGVPAIGANQFLRGQLSHTDKQSKKQTARLARIFAFAYEGYLYDLPRPAIFLVHGDGLLPDDPPPSNAAGKSEYVRLSRSPGTTARSGLGLQRGSFSKDIRVWIYDKGDFSMRLEVETGTFNDILLSIEADGSQAELGSGMGRSSGGRSSGAFGRSSGAMGRSSG